MSQPFEGTGIVECFNASGLNYSLFYLAISHTHRGKAGILDADAIMHILTSLDTSHLPCLSALLQLVHTAWGWQSLVPWRLEPFSRPSLSIQAGLLVLTPPKHLRILMNYHATGPEIWHPKRQLKGSNKATWHCGRVTFHWCKLWPVGKVSQYLSSFSSIQWTGLIHVPGRHISADYTGSVPPFPSVPYSCVRTHTCMYSLRLSISAFNLASGFVFPGT